MPHLDNMPAYERIKRDLKQRITEHALPEGAMLPSENELAVQYGVSRNQARQALRELELEGHVVRSQGRRSCVAAIAPHPRILMLGNGHTVALVFPSYQSLYARDIMDGFMRQIHESGYQAIVYNLRFDDETELDFLHHLRDSGVAGLALWLQHDQEEGWRILKSFRDSGFPVVLVDRGAHGVEVDYVASDNEALGYELTRALVDMGRKRIGILYETPTFTSTEGRDSGYRRALETAGLPIDTRFSKGLNRWQPVSASEAICSVMAHRQRPDAFFCIHDFIAKRAYDELVSLGYQIPEDVALSTVDDEHYAAELGFEIPALSQPSIEIGRQAAEVLIARIHEPERPLDQRSLPITNGKARTAPQARGHKRNTQPRLDIERR